MFDQNDRRPSNSLLAKLGRNDTFAGLTRAGISIGGILLTAALSWARADVQSALNDIKSNQEAIRRIGERTTVLEQQTLSGKENISEFRLWATSQVSGLTNQTNSMASDINRSQAAHERLESRVRCLEHKVPCPPS